jgi:hypothetical protein
MLRGLAGRPTFGHPSVDESSSLVASSRRNVVATNHEVSVSIPASSPCHHRVDELPSDAGAAMLWGHPHGDEFHPLLAHRLSTHHTNRRLPLMRHEGQLNLAETGLPALSRGIDPRA